MTEQNVEWRIDAATSRFIRLVIYGWVGLLGGASILALGLILFVALSAALAGKYTLFGLIVLLLLVGGPFSLLYLWPAVRSGSFTPLQRFVLDPATEPAESLGDRYAAVFSWWKAFASIGLHATAILLLMGSDPRLLGGYVAVWFVILVLVSGVQTWGRIDTEEPSFEYRSGTIPLAAIERVRRWRVGRIVVCWLSYFPGTKSITTPSLVVLTPAAAEAFDIARSAAENSPPEPRPTNTLAQTTAVAIGLGFIALAGGLWIIMRVDGPINPFSVLFGLAGVFIVWVGLEYT